MKIAFITDIHAYAFSEFSKNITCKWDNNVKRYVESEDGTLVLNSRLFNILSGMCDVRDYCVENHIRNVLNGGDVFHKRNTLDVTTFNCVYKVMKSYKDCGLLQIIISGNHDNATNSDDSPSSIETFSNFAEIITDPSIIYLEDEDSENNVVKIYCLPWKKDKKSSMKFLEMDKNHKSNILLAHLGVSGASIGSGYIMSDEYSLSDLRPDKWKYVLLGHYHRPQVLHENAIYGGSLLANDFGDEGIKHGFWVIDTDKRYDLQFIPLEYPGFATIKAEEIDEYSNDFIVNNYIRIQANVSNIDDISSKVSDVEGIRIDIEKEYDKNSRSDINIAMSYDEIIQTYVDEKVKEDETLSSDPLLHKGLDVIRKVGAVK